MYVPSFLSTYLCLHILNVTVIDEMSDNVPGLKDKITTAHITIITVGKKLLITFLTKDQGTDNFRTKTI